MDGERFKIILLIKSKLPRSAKGLNILNSFSN